MTSTRAPIRRAAFAAAGVAAALVLAACGDGGSHAGGHADTSAPASASAADHNAQDVAFAQGMIPHHRQALEMAALAADRAASPEVKDLAARIEKAQAPEIRTMTGWLESWGETVPSPGSGHSEHAGAEGMMDEEEMAELGQASGREFDTLFLTLMVEHHEGAVEMARTEQKQGRHGPAKEMAGAVISGQSAEIEEMKALLGTG
ncbi:DUF305 domain-containing protein [Streptomyces sp. enrichment culture]|uniref:DUF305 domain-containing protein n=1 Tax=Streptomyces sp. enrichment culture TaxID=1795815 RepID=UPI003F56C542